MVVGTIISVIERAFVKVLIFHLSIRGKKKEHFRLLSSRMIRALNTMDLHEHDDDNHI